MIYTFYKVFRRGTFNQTTLELGVPTTEAPNTVYFVKDDLAQADTLAKLNSLYPTGISPHGAHYLLDPYRHVRDKQGQGYTFSISAIELAFEQVRLHQFPEHPSRFASFFGCATLADAQSFRVAYCGGQGSIHRVSCERFFRADMKHLRLGAGILSTILCAEHYWRAEVTENPFWEILMQGPVTILDQVD